MPTRSSQIRATPEELFAVLTDYDKYAEWSPDVVASAVLVREGDIVVAEFQSPFLMDGKYILEFVHSRPSSITYQQVDQHEDRGLQGSWTISTAPDGSGTLVTARMEFRTDLWKRSGDRRRADRVLQRRVDALQAHVSRRGESAEESNLPDPSAFECLPEGQGLTVWASDVEYRFIKTGQ